MKSKSATRWIEYAALRTVESVVVLLPRRAALGLGASLGSLARILGVRRAVVDANVSYLEMSSDFVPELYRNMGRYLVDTLRSHRKVPPYRIENRELIDESDRKPVLALLAHFGNFELLASVFGSLFGQVGVIVKPMHNPRVEAWLDQRRRATGVDTVPHENAVRKAVSVLRRRGLLAALIDQYPGADGTPSVFLGKSALTVRAIAGLQDRLGPEVGSGYAKMDEHGVYDVVLRREEFDLEGLEGDARLDRIQELHNEIVGNWVRDYPEHWFGWFHRRFRPDVEYP